MPESGGMGRCYPVLELKPSGGFPGGVSLSITIPFLYGLEIVKSLRSPPTRYQADASEVFGIEE